MISLLATMLASAAVAQSQWPIMFINYSYTQTNPAIAVTQSGGGSASASLAQNALANGATMNPSSGSVSQNGTVTYTYEVAVAIDAPFDTAIIKYHQTWAVLMRNKISGSPLYSGNNWVRSSGNSGGGAQGILDSQGSSAIDDISNPNGSLSDIIETVDLYPDGTTGFYYKTGTFSITTPSIVSSVSLGVSPDNASSYASSGSTQASWYINQFYLGHGAIQ